MSLTEPAIVVDEALKTAIYQRFGGPGVRLIISYGSLTSPIDPVSGNRQLSIFVVIDDNKLIDWHKQNMMTHPKDYSLVCRVLPDKQLEQIQDAGAKILFLPDIPLGNPDDVSTIFVNCGVLGAHRALEDLNDWSNGMYFAGRLQRPVAFLHTRGDVEDEVFLTAMKRNRMAALCATLLVYPGPPSALALYSKIAELCMLGDDIGQTVAVGTSAPSLVNIADMDPIYTPLLEAIGVDPRPVDGTFTAQPDTATMMAQLPDIGLTPDVLDQPLALRTALIEDSLRTCQRGTAAMQGVKGVLTAPMKKMAPFLSAGLTTLSERFGGSGR